MNLFRLTCIRNLALLCKGVRHCKAALYHTPPLLLMVVQLRQQHLAASKETEIEHLHTRHHIRIECDYRRPSLQSVRSFAQLTVCKAFVEHIVTVYTASTELINHIYL